MKIRLLGVIVAFIVSVMLMVDVPVNANDPMMKDPMKGHGAAPAMMNHGELQNFRK